ncbi:MAG TPA: GtrA family protein [Cellulomonas sp.]
MTVPEPATAGGGPDGPGPRPLGPLFALIKDRRVAFLIVGGINTVLGTAWFVVFEKLFGEHLGTYGYLASLLAAHVAAVLCAFVLHRRLVFRVRGHVWLDLARFEVVNLSALGINLVALPFVVEVVGMSPIPGQLLVTCVTALATYVGHRDFSFRRRPAADDADGPTGTADPTAPADPTDLPGDRA